MAKKKKQDASLLQRFASGGRNKQGSRRGGTRPRGEGRGLIDSVRAIFGRK